ncbi:MAG TPA: NF038132 family protein [Candidatus Cybelea sp.]|nr:NF038132 family protein [Candidatus Cybelea sp.]
MRKLVILGIVLLAGSGVALADGLPTGWTCNGSCGTLGANGVVPTPPSGSSYEWISTFGSKCIKCAVLPSGSPIGGEETNGSTLISPTFSATAGSLLGVFVDYVSSDGGIPIDYAWAALFTSSNTLVAVIFTDQTDVVTMASTGTTWSPLGIPSSGSCAGTGCGNTGWTDESYTIGAAGSYYVEFGVTNVYDQLDDSGLAINDLNLNGVPIGKPVPEPATLGLLAMAFGGLAQLRRRRPA